MKPWKPGDKIAPGQLYIPPGDTETRAAYVEQAHVEQVEAQAQAVVRQRSLAERRRVLSRTPKGIIFEVKQRVSELWKNQKTNS